MTTANNPLICPRCLGQMQDDLLKNLFICEECNYTVSAERDGNA